jgi:hypothetical protein
VHSLLISSPHKQSQRCSLEDDTFRIKFHHSLWGRRPWTNQGIEKSCSSRREKFHDVSSFLSFIVEYVEGCLVLAEPAIVGTQLQILRAAAHVPKKSFQGLTVAKPFALCTPHHAPTAESPMLERSEMANRKSYLIFGRLPKSPLMKSIQSKHDVTHIPTRGVSRDVVLKQIASLPEKSFTFVCMLSETQPLHPLDKALFGSLEIECFCKVGAGYDSIDVEYFTSKGTWVANAPNAVRIPTAEYCVSLIVATVKGLGVVDRNVRQGKWRYGLGFQSNIQGMTLGIIGLGAIGKVFVL